MIDGFTLCLSSNRLLGTSASCSIDSLVVHMPDNFHERNLQNLSALSWLARLSLGFRFEGTDDGQIGS